MSKDMSLLMKVGNIAVFEYPALDDPEFELDKNNVLWIFGYNMSFAGRDISTAKRVELPIVGYTLVGKFETAKKVIQGDFIAALNESGFDINNCVFFIKKEDGQMG